MKILDDTKHFEDLKNREAELRARLKEDKAGFDPNQPRDRSGRWTSTGGGKQQDDEKVKRNMKKFEDNIRKQEFETAGVFDPKTGKLVFFKNGSDSAVQFTDEELLAMKGMMCTHNHPFPGSGSLSVQDLMSGLYNELHSIKAVSENGEWAEAVFDIEYYNEMRQKISELNDIPIERVNIPGLLEQVANVSMEHFKQNNAMSILMVDSFENQEERLYDLNRRYGIEFMKDLNEGFKEWEANWAPVEIDKLFTIKTGKDEV